MNMPARKIKNTWWVDFQFQNQRYRTRSPQNTKAGAQAYESVLRMKLANGEDIRNSQPDAQIKFAVFVREWFEEYVVPNNKPSTQRAKDAIIRIHLVPAFGKLELGDITKRKIERYKAQKKHDGLSNKSINNHLSVLRTCLTYAQEDEKLNKLPSIQRLKQIQPKVEYFTEEESLRLLESASGTQWHAMILCALHTGMRFGELCGLDWQDVSFDRNQIIVRQSLVEGNLDTPKSGKTRYVPMTHQLREALYQIKKPRGYVFTYDGEPMPRFVAYKYLNQIYKKAGLRKAGWHALRHTFASTLIAKGATMHSVQKLLGHSTIAMTERYAHLAPSALDQAVSLLETQKETFTEFWARERQSKQKTPNY